MLAIRDALFVKMVCINICSKNNNSILHNSKIKCDNFLGVAVPMSFDHKPYEAIEFKRIKKAGGHIDGDNRINGGLNLSRAIGDHAYKQNQSLSDKEQMITALPDIKIATINPAEDEFMVLACDGIWECYSNQEVVDFVKQRLQEGRKNLSQICEEVKYARFN